MRKNNDLQTVLLRQEWSQTRRTLLHGAVAAIASIGFAYAQPQSRVFRAGVLAPDSRETRQPFVEIFIQAMRGYGYIEGKNIAYDARYAGGDTARLAELAADLVSQNLDIIVAPNGLAVQAAAKAAAQAKRDVPIVFVGWATPVGSGLVASLARPGGNATGMTNITTELAGKQLQLLKEAVPKISRVAVFVDSTTTGSANYAEQVEKAAKTLGMQMLIVELRRTGDADSVIAQLRKWRADSIFVTNAPINFNNRRALVQIAGKMRLPAVYGNDVYVEIGGLFSYGSDDKLRWQQIARFADKILKGTKAGDIPVEIPTTFAFVVNMKTAKSLGITFPPTIMVQATKVIE